MAKINSSWFTHQNSIIPILTAISYAIVNGKNQRALVQLQQQETKMKRTV